MSRKVAVTEKLRKEIRAHIAELTPTCSWYTIPRDERESVKQAYLRIDKEGKAERFSDDGVTSMIYEKSRGRQLLAERAIKWLEENDLWIGTRLYDAESEAEPAEE